MRQRPSFLIIAAALACASACGPGSDAPSGTDGEQQAPQDAGLNVSPGSGPDDTEATVRVTGAQPNTDVDIRYGVANTSARADGDGVAVARVTFNGVPGPVDVVATGIGNVELASATFTITGPAPGSTLPPPESTTTVVASTIPDPTPPAPTVTLTVSPDSGPAGSPVSIVVNGPPGEPVTLYLRGSLAQTGGSTNDQGVYTFPTSFTGNDGEVVDVRAEMTIGGVTGSADGTFTITPSVEPLPSTTVPVDESDGEPIGFVPGALELTEFHETDQLRADLLAAGALSVVFAAPTDGLSIFDALFLVADSNGSGLLDEGDRVLFEPQPIVDGEPTALPIDSFGAYFVGAVPAGWTFPNDATGRPLSPSRGDDGSWQLFDGAEPVIFDDGFESGTPTAWVVDGTPEMAP